MSVNNWRTSLPVAHRTPDQWHWRLQSSELTDVADAALTCMQADADQSPVYTLIKQRSWRKTFLLRHRDRAYFVKCFKLRSRQQVQATLRLVNVVVGDYKGAFMECASTFLAQHLIGQVPKVYGFGEQRNRWGLILQQVIIFEALTQHIKLRQVIAAAGTDTRQKLTLLERASRIILALYRHNAVHLDLNISNVMVSNRQGEQDYVIDLEPFIRLPKYGKRERETRMLLAYCYGYLYKVNTSDYVPESVYDEFAYQQMDKVLAGAQLPPDASEAYQYFKHHHLTHSKRILLTKGWFKP